MTDRLEDLADALTLDEQASLTAGDDVWNTVGLPERGLGRVKVSDGPVGVRGESHTTTTSASFPCGTALGATFDPALVHRVAAALGDEARTKGVHVLLGPTVNLVRHPLGGRNFEAYGEDPLLTSTLATAFVQGVQSRGVAACVKHLVANDAEIERLTISSEVDERTLREVYLRPFEAAVLDAGVWSVMGSYNRVNGTFACEHEWLLRTVLKGEWGFDGLVISDWHATHDTVRCARGGLDLEMPGPSGRFGARLADAVRRGEVPAEVVADQARRVLRLADRVGATAGPEPEEQSVDDPGRWVLAREAAAAAMVLLRNEPLAGGPVLPLDPTRLRRVAVIGPNAGQAMIQGGGSARVTPHRVVTPLAGLRARLGPEVEIVMEEGCATGQVLPVLDDRLALAGDEPGILMEYRADPGGPVLFSNTLPHLDPVWYGRFSPAVDPDRFHVTARATIVAPRTGTYVLGLTSVGPARVTFDGTLVIDTVEAGPGSSFFGFGGAELTAEIELEAGASGELVVQYPRPENQLAGFRVGLRAPLGDDPIGRAAAAAAGADVAVVVVGTDEEWETEGRDRQTMSLPGEQDELVRRVVEANPNTVVVVNAGAAVDLPWADLVPAILVAWFPGMAGGEALARVLVGDDEPGGRLPFTVPSDLADAPCDISRADPAGQLRYTEGLLVGHRWYLTHDVEPRWWFGQGLSYTTFSWGSPVAPGSWSLGSPLVVTVPVANTGRRLGTEVVQAYLRRPASTLARPRSVLGGFANVRLGAGAAAEVTVEIDLAALRHWDGTGWVIEPGPLEIRVARSAGDPGQVVNVGVTPVGASGAVAM